MVTGGYKTVGFGQCLNSIKPTTVCRQLYYLLECICLQHPPGAVCKPVRTKRSDAVRHPSALMKMCFAQDKDEWGMQLLWDLMMVEATSAFELLGHGGHATPDRLVGNIHTSIAPKPRLSVDQATKSNKVPKKVLSFLALNQCKTCISEITKGKRWSPINDYVLQKLELPKQTCHHRRIWRG